LDALGADFQGEAATRLRMKSCTVLGELHRVRDAQGDAEREHREALALALAPFGDASAEVAESRNNLAGVSKACGRWQDARALYEQALATFTRLDGESSPGVAAVLHNMGGILHAQGEYAAAEPYSRRAWEISRDTLGENHPGTLRDLGAYAAVLDGLERH